MKFKHFLPLCAMALPLCATAVPAKPGLVPATLADGTTVMVEAHGDEFFNYVTDEQGFLLSRTPLGKFTYKLDPNGARLSATPRVLEEMRATTIASLPEGLQRSAANGGPSRMTALDRYGRATFPTTGDGHYLVLLIQYSDLSWSVDDPATVMNERLNGENYDYMGSEGSMREYYIRNSGGKFKPTFDIVGPITLPKTNAYYVGDGKYDKIAEAVTSAIWIADEQFGVDYSKYDIDDDGIIDNVIIFYAGYGQADIAGYTQDAYGNPVPPAIWPHNSSLLSLGLRVDNKVLGNYCCFCELNGSTHFYYKDGAIDGVGTPIHEFGHVMGMPDLYDPKYVVKATPGSWSVMDSGCYNGDSYVPCNLSSYERWLFNWIDYDELEEPGIYTINPISDHENALRLKVNKSWNNEYFLFESRPRVGFDRYLLGEGMLIWHIDYYNPIWQDNSVNSEQTRPRCHLVTADGSANYRLGDLKSSNLAAWPVNCNYITPETEINLYAYYAANVGPVKHYFSNIAFDAETGVSSFGFDQVTSTPDVTTVLQQPFRPTNSQQTVRLEWDPVEGAQGYALTWYRITSTGTKFYENSLNEKNIGNVTSYEMAIAANKMGVEFHAYVRPIMEIPSGKTSNEVVFVPNQLEVRDPSGIDEVLTEEEVPVRGLQGAIDAPASARVFTLTGAPAGRDNLAAGIYLVQVGTRTYKVIVK